MAKLKFKRPFAGKLFATQGSGKKLVQRLAIYRVHALIAVLSLIAIVAMFPRGKSYQFADLKEGEIYIGEKIVAPFTFSINKTPEEYAQDTTAAKRAVAPVFVRVDSITEVNVKAIASLLDSTETIIKSLAVDSTKRTQLNNLFDSSNIIVTEEILSFLIDELVVTRRKTPAKVSKDTARAQASVDFDEFTARLQRIARDIYAIGVLNVSKNDLPTASEKIAIDDGKDEYVENLSAFLGLEAAKKTVLEKLRANFASEGAIKTGYEILGALIQPNIHYKREETSRRIRSAVARVPKAKGRVLEKERIIDSHEKITKDHILKLTSLAQAKAEREAGSSNIGFLMPLLGKVIMASLALAFLFVYLFTSQPKVFADPKKLLMILISILLVLFLGHLVGNLSLSRYLIPVALGSMLLTIFFGTQIGFMGTIVLGILLGVVRGNEFGIMLITLVVGSAGIISVRRVRSRSWLFKSFLWVSGGYVISIIALDLLRYSELEVTTTNLLYGILSGFLSPFLTYGLMVIFEYVFDMTTDATLLELSDLNKPLLRQLALRSPGSYHHSILVGTLSEAAAESIGANSLLTRVGAYYHDIGKMEKPEYFIENQKGGKNPHDKLSPRMSYLILVSHVKRGLEIAEEHGLPKEIQAFIAEHHGTTLIKFFYKKALEQSEGGEISESDFRYPGPKPQSKETGIVMLADAVEAASRTLKDPSVNRLQTLVNNIIDDRFKNCELDESPLTLRDLNAIQEAFVQILTGIFHGRIEYPDQGKLVPELEVEAGSGSDGEAGDDAEKTSPVVINGQNL